MSSARAVSRSIVLESSNQSRFMRSMSGIVSIRSTNVPKRMRSSWCAQSAIHAPMWNIASFTDQPSGVSPGRWRSSGDMPSSTSLSSSQVRSSFARSRATSRSALLFRDELEDLAPDQHLVATACASLCERALDAVFHELALQGHDLLGVVEVRVEHPS